MVRIATNLFLISTFLVTGVFAQVAKPELVTISKMRKRILTKERFADVPEQVRRYHAKGSTNVLLQIDTAGNVENVHMLSGFSHVDYMRAFIEKEVGGWKFKPLKRKGQMVPYRGVVSIPFCYGGFPPKPIC